jgi:hypothetical protein
MPIVYANIPQSIYCSRPTYLPSCLGYFYRLDIQSVMLVLSTKLCELSNLLSKFTSPLPKVKVENIQTVCGWQGVGVGVLSCVGDHILHEFNTQFLTRLEPTKLLHHPKQKPGRRRPQTDKHLPQGHFTGQFFCIAFLSV